MAVRLHAQTSRVDERKDKAIGVALASGAGTETLRADREVIVSCGAVGSRRLLQLSGIGPACKQD